MAQYLSVLRHLTPRGKITIAAAIGGVLLALVLLAKIAGHPSYSTVMAGLDPAQTGKITAALDQQGISYDLRSNGTALAVESSQVGRARVALASAGLPASDQPGFELFDKRKLGASDFEQQVTYQRALEGQIARTIEGVQGVGSAQVQLVLPGDQLFAADRTQSSAAVLLSSGSDALGPGAVQGIARLVASSVKGLSTKDVTIADASGALLWPTGDGGAGGGPTAKLAAQHAYEASLDAQLGALLTGTLGANKARVKTNVELDTSEGTENKLHYAKTGVPLKVTKDTETLKGKGASLSGAAGASSNVTGYAANGAGGSGNTNYSHTKGTTDYGVDKVVTRSTISPGAVKHLNVALMLDDSVPHSQIAGLTKTLSAAAGVVASRGDAISVTRLPFAAPPAANPATGPLTDPMGAARYAALGLAALAFLAYAVRHLRRREQELVAGDPTWLREIQSTVPLTEMERAPTALPAAPATPREELEDLATREPERVAQQVRSWMTDG